MATTTSRLGLKVIDTPAVDLVSELRQSINNHATILDAQYIESTYALRPAAASKGRVHRSTDTGEVAIDTGSAWEPVWGAPSLSRPVLDVGQVGQTRAGRQLAVADFTDCGAAAPIALYNLGSTADASGAGLGLTNKGTVTFGTGIEGAASTAAVFTGSTAQALYRSDTGGADPLRIRTGSWGCWIKTAKRGASQGLVGRWRVAGNLKHFLLFVESGNRVRAYGSTDGAADAFITGTTDVCDDRWHFAVATHDGSTLRLYIDGALEVTTPLPGALSSVAAPFNVGGYGADAGVATGDPHWGKIDEAFVTNEVLSPEQIRYLYGVKLAHGLGSQPRRASLRVTRRRRGAALANGDFPSNPVRAYNFAAGALTDLNGGAAVTAVGGGSIISAAGPDGQKDSGQLLSGAHTGLGATDTGLPSGTNARSYGLFFNIAAATAQVQILMSWGTNVSADTKVYVRATTGFLAFANGADDAVTAVNVCDGVWHHAWVVEDNAAVDGLKRKLYLDGKLVAASTVLNAITLAGANRFRIGANPDGSGPAAASFSRAAVFAGALTAEQIAALYAKASSAGVQKPAPRNEGDYIDGLSSTSLVFIAGALEPQHLVDLEVSR